jgi:ferritin
MQLNTDLIRMLEKQATHEITAAMAYLAISNWCASQDYPGFAEFFKKQFDEELEHSGKFQNHLLERGINPKIGSISAPKCDYGSLQEVAEMALTLERENTVGIVACYELACQLKDYASQPMLQWFISEQMEEEAWASSMVTHTQRLTCPGALINLDRHICKILGD